ncbi:P-loop NTPase fold protein [Pseudofrankia sp. BMG5.37]|uniref:P-loop NTPase fold protein n=1 Tax=Pseudofrankia sp. BMG5.37 TaxID=3050035 RepID=UPI00289468FA|nr:P-loop NTPase fold protein [Pseudofrankia sp. BMG5.37]MDT3444765.1 P-loop NTPase fold protein [Pseudofrankia sp. BMG5.37]
MAAPRSELTREEVQALASAFSAQSAARLVLERAGLPRERQPSWQAGDAIAFWTEVARLLALGAVVDGRQKVLAAALEEFPYNQVLRAGYDGEPRGGREPLDERASSSSGVRPEARRSASPPSRAEAPEETVAPRPSAATEAPVPEDEPSSRVDRPGPAGDGDSAARNRRFPASASRSQWTRYAADAVLPAPASDAPTATDALDIAGDVATLAKLVVARTPPPPLAIALLGRWGSGKSSFMLQMRYKAQKLAEIAAERSDPQKSAFVGRVLQIEFNAWHYSDDRVWTGLVDRLFRELATAYATNAPPAGSAGEVRAERKRLHARREEEAKRRDRLAADLRTIDGSPTGQGRFARHRALRWFVLSAKAWARDVWADLAASWRILAQVVALVVVVGLAWWYGADVATRAHAHALARFGPPVVTALAVLYPGWRFYRTLRSRAEQVHAELSATLAGVDETIGELDRQLVVVDAAAGLASFVADRSADSAYADYRGLVGRVRDDLAQLQDRLDTALAEWNADREAAAEAAVATGEAPGGTGTEQATAGTRSARRKAARKAKTAAEDREAKELGAAGSSRPLERIVLYVDDLDRCPPKVVVEVLAAVHLLLALRLFVVVVAVDPDWLHGAVNTYRDGLFADEESPDGAFWTTGDYLEKIFQIPFALASMDDMGDSGRDYLRGLMRPAEETEASARPAVGPTGPAPADTAPADTAPADTAPADTAPAGAEQPTDGGPAPDDPGLLLFSTAEEAFLPELHGLVRTPRAGKRLVNLYRLVRIGVSEADRPSFIADPDDAGSGGEYQVVAILLAALVRDAVAAGQLFERLAALDGTDPDILTTLRAHGSTTATTATTATGVARASTAVHASDEETRALRVLCLELAGLVESLGARDSATENVMEKATVRQAALYQKWQARVSRFSFHTAVRRPPTAARTPPGG